MKNLKLFIVAVAIAVSGTAGFAQNGVHLGFIHSADNLQQDGHNVHNPKYNGFMVGVDRERDIVGDMLSVQIGLYYYHLLDQGDASEIENLNIRYTESYTQNYLTLPMYLKLGFSLPGTMKLYVFAGPTFALGLVDKVKYTSDEYGSATFNNYNGKVKTTATSAYTLAALMPDSDQTDRFDVMLGGGVGLQLVEHVDLRIGYDHGLINRCSDSRIAQGYSAHRRQFYFAIGINF